MKSIATAALLALTAVSAHAQTTYNWDSTVQNALWAGTTINWDQATPPGSLLNGGGALDDIVNILNNVSGANNRNTLLDAAAGTIGELHVGGAGVPGATGNAQLQMREGGSLTVTGTTTLGDVVGTTDQLAGQINMNNGTNSVTLADVVSGSTSGANLLQVDNTTPVLTINGDIDTSAVRILAGLSAVDSNEIDLRVNAGIDTGLVFGGGVQTFNLENFDVVNGFGSRTAELTVPVDKTINALQVEVGRISSSNANNATSNGTLNIYGGVINTVNDVRIGHSVNAVGVHDTTGTINVGSVSTPGTLNIGDELRMSVLSQATSDDTSASFFNIDNAASVVTIANGLDLAFDNNGGTASATFTINDGLATVAGPITDSTTGSSTINVLGGEVELLFAGGAGLRSADTLNFTGGTVDFLVYSGMPPIATTTTTLAALAGGSLIDLTNGSGDTVPSTDDTTSAIASGDWFTPTIWDTGALPGEGARISTGESVTLLTSTNALAGDSAAASIGTSDGGWSLAQNANDITATRTGAAFSTGPGNAAINGAFTVTSAVDLNIQNAAGVGAHATQVEVGAGALSLTGSANLIIGGTAQGTVTQSGGTVTVPGDLLFGGGGLEGGTYTLGGGSLNVTGAIVEGASGLPDSAVNNAQLLVDGGILDAANITVQRFAVGQDAGTTGSHTMDPGETITTTGTMSIGSNGDGTLVATDATINVGTNYVGAESAGSASSVTLNGTTTISAPTNVFDIANAPGQSAVFTMNDSSSITNAGGDFRVADAGVGTLNMNGSSSITQSGGNFEVSEGVTGDGNGVLNMNTTGTISLSTNNFILGQGDSSTATLNLTSGTIDMTLAFLGNAGQGDFNMNGGTGILNMDGGTILAGEDFNLNGGTATVNMTGGTIQTGDDLNFTNAGGETGTFKQSGGTVLVGDRVLFRNNGVDTLDLSGDAVFRTGQSDSTTATVDGRFVINNTSSAGLGGNQLFLRGSNVTLEIAENLAADSDATFNWEFDDTTVSPIVVNGTVAINGASAAFTHVGTLPPSSGDHVLIDNQGTAGVVGTFAGLPEGGVVTIGAQNYLISYIGNAPGDIDSNDVVLFAVSDPIVTITADALSIVEGDIASWTVTATPAPASGDTIFVDIFYDGIAADGSDFSGVYTADIIGPAGTANLDVPTMLDGIFEGGETIIAVIDFVAGDFSTPEVGEPSQASIGLFDANVFPTANENLSQSAAGTGTVPINDIVVADPDAAYDSNYGTTTATPIYTYNGLSDVSSFFDARAVDDFAFDLDDAAASLDDGAGFALDLDFIPAAGDLSGTTLVWEMGGRGSGSSLYLLEGIPHLLVKCGGNAADVPTDDGSVAGVFTDLNWDNPSTAPGNADDDCIVVPLGTTAFIAGVPARIAIVFEIIPGDVTYSVNGSAPTTVGTTGRDNQNWNGDHSTAHFQRSSAIGGSNNVSGAPFDDTGTRKIKNFVNGFTAGSSVRFWNDSIAGISATPGLPEQLTATFTIGGWTTTTDGVLTALTDLGGGVFEVVGDIFVVNAALAAMEFIETTASYPVIIDVNIQDAAGASISGDIVVIGPPPTTVFVDDNFSGSVGASIADADGGSATSPANFRVDAFTSWTNALNVVAPGGTVVVNDGTYPESANVTGTLFVRVTDTSGGVRVDSLSSDAGTTIQIDSPNTLEVGDALGDSTIAGVVSGAGGLTKLGADTHSLTGANTHTGVITVSAGILSIGDNASTTAALAGSGSTLTIAFAGNLHLSPAVDRTITVARTIDGDGFVASQGDGTVVFTGGPNPFTGNFQLGDGTSSFFDGVDQGAKEGFVVVNTSGDLGTGLITSRGGQLQAGSAGINIANDISVEGGGLRMGGLNDFELSGLLSIVGGTRGISHLGLDGVTITISNEINNDDAGTPRGVNFEASNGRDNGDFLVGANIVGPGNVSVQGSFDDGSVTFSGTNTYTGTTNLAGGAGTRVVVLNGAHTGGGPYAVNSGVLAGVGSTDSTVNVGLNGIIAGSDSLTTAGSLGIGDLNVLGTVRLEVADTAGTTAGLDFSQISVTGAVNFDTTTSALEIAEFAGANLAAATITVIANDDVDAVTGTFAGLPESSSLPRGTESYGTISYVGDSGNDVTITFNIDLTDTDGDGIPDFYEIANGLDETDPSDAGTDPDGDGTTALQEWLFGTEENNAASAFKLTLTAHDPDLDTADLVYGPVFAFLDYQLSGTSDAIILDNIGAVFAPAVDAASNTEIDPAATTGLKIYRVQVTGNALP